MACVFTRGCSEDNSAVLSITSHGTTVGFCEKHHTEAVRKYTATASAEMVDDYVKLQLLMVSTELFLKVMKHFTNEVSRNAKKRASISCWFNRDMVPMSLNQALWRYEQLCWFGQQKKIMSGLLSFEEFKSSITSGYMVKDPGPGPDHGEFSHRLQWQYIMRIVTNRFSVPKTDDWNFTPLELYCGMFKAGNVWGTMLEGQQLSAGSRPGNPNWVNKQFQGEGGLGRTSFGSALTRRINKRKTMVDSVKLALEARYPQKEISVTEAESLRRDKPDRINVHSVIEYLYKWKKAGKPAVKPTVKPADAEWKTPILQQNLDAAWALWNASPQQYQSSRTQEPQYKRAALSEELGEGISDGLLLHQSEAVTDAPLAERIESSKGGLNPVFSYSKSVGAKARTRT